jgi:hypothetical protein
MSTILQIGGFHQGLTDSLLSTLKAGMCGQALTSKIVILDSVEETVVQIREKYDNVASTVNALYFDKGKSLRSQMRWDDGFDVLLVAIDRHLDDESKQVFLTEARSMLKAGGMFVVFDKLRDIREQ